MRIPKSWVAPMAKRIIEDLIRRGYIELNFPPEETKIATKEILLDELTIEDRLNGEVREILRKHSYQIEHKRLDYKRLFDLTKHKLIRERNLVL